MIYKTFDELNGKTLASYDKLEFKVGRRVLLYEVSSSGTHLFTDGYSNASVFLFLRVSQRKFLTTAYGYAPRSGSWLESKSADFEGLTRAALMLFAKIEGFEIKFVGVSKYDGPEYFDLCSDYMATIYADHVEVGCQRFDKKTMEKFIKVCQKQFRKKQ